MSESKARKLSIVKKAEAGEPITIKMGEATRVRLHNKVLQLSGAQAAAKVTVEFMKGLEQALNNDIAAIVEVNDINVTGYAINCDTDKGEITLTPPPNSAPADAS